LFFWDYSISGISSEVDIGACLNLDISGNSEDMIAEKAKNKTNSMSVIFQ
jgi:hypothetical protein